MLCLDDCSSTTIMPQLTEITQFIFGQPKPRWPDGSTYIEPIQLELQLGG
jgi:hypothetical protein